MAHFSKAGSYRLVVDIKQKFSWLDEYFCWQEWRPQLRYLSPRFARNLASQESWFKKQLPDHLLFIQLGQFWKPVSRDERDFVRFPVSIYSSNLNKCWPLIDQTRKSIGWIGETGRRIEAIAERALYARWHRPTA